MLGIGGRFGGGTKGRVSFFKSVWAKEHFYGNCCTFEFANNIGFVLTKLLFIGTPANGTSIQKHDVLPILSKCLPGNFVVLLILLAENRILHLDQLLLEHARKWDDGGSGVVLVHPLLDLH